MQSLKVWVLPNSQYRWYVSMWAMVVFGSCSMNTRAATSTSMQFGPNARISARVCATSLMDLWLVQRRGDSIEPSRLENRKSALLRVRVLYGSDAAGHTVQIKGLPSLTLAKRQLGANAPRRGLVKLLDIE